MGLYNLSLDCDCCISEPPPITCIGIPTSRHELLYSTNIYASTNGYPNDPGQWTYMHPQYANYYEPSKLKLIPPEGLGGGPSTCVLYWVNNPATCKNLSWNPSIEYGTRWNSPINSGANVTSLSFAASSWLSNDDSAPFQSNAAGYVYSHIRRYTRWGWRGDTQTAPTGTWFDMVKACYGATPTRVLVNGTFRGYVYANTVRAANQCFPLATPYNATFTAEIQYKIGRNAQNNFITDEDESRAVLSGDPSGTSVPGTQVIQDINIPAMPGGPCVQNNWGFTIPTTPFSIDITDLLKNTQLNSHIYWAVKMLPQFAPDSMEIGSYDGVVGVILGTNHDYSYEAGGNVVIIP